MTATPPTGKKGLPTIAKIGIGCLIFLVLAGGIGGFIVWKAANWVKDEVTGFMENPQAAIATTIISNHPELELLESDPDSGTFKLKYAKDGKTYTTKLADLKEGRIVLIDENGNETIIGNADIGKIPGWVPQPSQISETRVIFVNTNEGKSSGQYMANHKGDPTKSIEAIKEAFPGDGNEQSSEPPAGQPGQWTLQLTSGNKTLTAIIFSDGNEGQLTINWSEE